MKKIIFNLKATSMVLLFVLTSSTYVSAQESNVPFGREVNPEDQIPTLTSVSIAPSCVGSSAAITFSGLQPSQFGSVEYKLSSSNNVFTESGTATELGTFTFNTEPVNAGTNGLVLSILSITNSEEATTTFGLNEIIATFVVKPQPTLGMVTSVPTCAGTSVLITLSGLLPSKTGVVVFQIGDNEPVTRSRNSNPAGNNVFGVFVNEASIGLDLKILSITTDGCTTFFEDKSTALVVFPRPTLTTVTAAPICVGTSGNVVLSGLLPNTSGFATYRIANGPLLTQTGMSSNGGTFSIPTNVLGPNVNGAVIQITRLTTDAGCFRNFPNRSVTLVVNNNNCPPIMPMSRFAGNSGKDGDKNGVGVNSDLTLYPNPAKEVLNIDTAAEVTSVEVLNMQGQRMLTSTEKQINISNLPAGTYVVRVQDAQNNVVVKRVVKN